MIFLIQYDPVSGESTWLEFGDGQMETAQARRLELERDARAKSKDPEIVILSAQDRADLKRTHSKYFRDDELSNRLGEAV